MRIPYDRAVELEAGGDDNVTLYDSSEEKRGRVTCPRFPSVDARPQIPAHGETQSGVSRTGPEKAARHIFLPSLSD